VYEGEYHDEHPNILSFWEVFEDLTPQEKKKFLRKYETSDVFMTVRHVDFKEEVNNNTGKEA